MNPVVSIITPAYNAARFLRATLDSAISQTFSDWEMLLIDDCSTDSTSEIIREYADRDSRIRPMKTVTNTGIPSEVRNIGIRAAQGRYIAFLDADDIWLPNKLEEQVECIRRHDCGMVFSDYEKMDEGGVLAGRIVKGPDSVTYHQLLGGNVILQSSGLFDVEKVGKPEFMDIHHEDFKFWLDVLKRTPCAVNTQKVHVRYRVRFHSLSGNKFRAMLWTWRVYRKAERLSFVSASINFFRYLLYSGHKFMK